jgi:transcription elongation factor Elf1
MTLTCPFCQSRARLSPNPAHAERNSLPVYIFTCSGCDHTSVRATLVRGQLATTNASGA